MSNIEAEEADDLLDFIYDDEEPQHSILSKEDFKRWHHPRKHWVRINQLCQLSQNLFQETHFPDGIIRYLTLPGEELIDIQALEKAANNNHQYAADIEGVEGSEELMDIQALQGALQRISEALKIKYLGFNNIGKNPVRMATQEHAASVLHDLESIHSSSSIVNNLVQTIANKQSVSYKSVRDNGPFNVINLDLCNSVAASEKDGLTHFSAIKTILELQKQNTTQPFLLFVATRTEISDLDPEAMGKITAVYHENFKNSPDFRTKFEEVVELKANELLDRLRKGEHVEQSIMNKVFGVGLGKWLLHLMKPTQPAWDVTLESICAYGIGDKEGSMLSLAFKFTQVNVGIHDSTGLSQTASELTIVKDEPELALEMLKVSKEIIDVDKLLIENTEVREKVIRQSGSLLAKVGYDEEKYKAWASQLFSDPCEVAKV